MAKRKRLTPVRLDPSEDTLPAPETKSDASGTDHDRTPPAGDTATDDGAARPARRRPPIAGVAGEAAAIAALNEMGQGLESARAEGRLLVRLPLDDIDVAYLVRDRIAFDTDEMEVLEESLRRRGQQTAIEVADLGDERAAGRWGLISGWRRITALRRIGAADVLAAVRRPDTARDAYRAMVEENEIRAALSYYERARIVVRAAETGVYADKRLALSDLFASASRPRRSKIGSFVRIVQALDGVLRFPASLAERQGLALVKVLDADEGAVQRIGDALCAADPQDARAEAAVLASVIAPRSTSKTVRREEYLRPGLLCRETDDELVLKGPALSEALRDKLRAWLSENK